MTIKDRANYNNLSQSMEDYLEAILIISNEKKIIRVKDIVNYFNYKVSSVNYALNVLSEKGLVIHDKYEDIELTTDGFKLAEKLYKKHLSISKFLSHVLKVDSKIAEKDACLIEHYLHKNTYQNLIKFLDYIEKEKSAGKKLLFGFQKYLVKDRKK